MSDGGGDRRVLAFDETGVLGRAMHASVPGTARHADATRAATLAMPSDDSVNHAAPAESRGAAPSIGATVVEASLGDDQGAWGARVVDADASEAERSGLPSPLVLPTAFEETPDSTATDEASSRAAFAEKSPATTAATSVRIATVDGSAAVVVGAVGADVSVEEKAELASAVEALLGEYGLHTAELRLNGESIVPIGLRT